MEFTLSKLIPILDEALLQGYEDVGKTYSVWREMMIRETRLEKGGKISAENLES